jgi:hypothetical protein
MLLYFVQKSNISKELLIRTGLMKAEGSGNEIEEYKSQCSKGELNSNFSRKNSYLNETTISLDSKQNESFFIHLKSNEDLSYKPNLKAEIESQCKNNNGKAYCFDNIYIKELFNDNPFVSNDYNQDLVNSLVNVRWFLI